MNSLFIEISIYEIIRAKLVFIHLISFSVCIAIATYTTWELIAPFNSKELNKQKIAFLVRLSKYIRFPFVILVLSGLSFIPLYWVAYPELIYNQKMYAKLIVVVILCLQAFYLHGLTLTRVLKNRSKESIKLTPKDLPTEVIILSLSTYFTWLFAAVLGVSKSLNFFLSISELLAIYITLNYLIFLIVFLARKGSTAKT